MDLPEVSSIIKRFIEHDESFKSWRSDASQWFATDYVNQLLDAVENLFDNCICHWAVNDSMEANLQRIIDILQQISNNCSIAQPHAASLNKLIVKIQTTLTDLREVLKAAHETH